VGLVEDQVQGVGLRKQGGSQASVRPLLKEEQSCVAGGSSGLWLGSG
jgi:hypothetical protein